MLNRRRCVPGGYWGDCRKSRLLDRDRLFIKVAAAAARGYDETNETKGLPGLAWRQDAAAVMPAMTITAQPLARPESRFAAPGRGTQIP